jgi:ABC-type nitrate/sulfonate/bicarbonate transport system substrate-binding protein
VKLIHSSLATVLAVVLLALLASPVALFAVDQPIVGIAGPAINMIYSFIARDAGLFKKYDIEPKLVVFDSGSVLAQAAMAGDAKISVTSGPVTIASRTQGGDAIVVASCVNTPPYSIVAAKSITRWDQLKGKRVAMSRFGSGTDTSLRLVLRKFGIDAKDLIILQLGTQPSRYQALLAGNIEATIISPPLDLMAKKDGFNILVSIPDLKIPYPQQTLETTDRFAREHPQIVKNFLKGYIEGVYFAAKNKEQTLKAVLKYLKTSSDPEILDATYKSFVEVTDYSARPNLEGIRNAMDEVALRLPAVKNKKPEDFVNTRFLQELEKEGFFKSLSK